MKPGIYKKGALYTLHISRVNYEVHGTRYTVRNCDTPVNPVNLIGRTVQKVCTVRFQVYSSLQ